MLQVEVIRTFYAFNAWANNRILNAAQRLTRDQFLAPAGMSFPSVCENLIHLMDVQRTWLARFQHLPNPAVLDKNALHDVASIRTTWAGIEASTQTFVASLEENRLEKIVHYTNDQGEPNAYPLWQMMIHQVNHATQHRSEVAMALTQFGHSPGWLDFLIYIDSLQNGSEL